MKRTNFALLGYFLSIACTTALFGAASSNKEIGNLTKGVSNRKPPAPLVQLCTHTISKNKLSLTNHLWLLNCKHGKSLCAHTVYRAYVNQQNENLANEEESNYLICHNNQLHLLDGYFHLKQPNNSNKINTSDEEQFKFGNWKSKIKLMNNRLTFVAEKSKIHKGFDYPYAEFLDYIVPNKEGAPFAATLHKHPKEQLDPNLEKHILIIWYTGTNLMNQRLYPNPKKMNVYTRTSKKLISTNKCEMLKLLVSQFLNNIPERLLNLQEWAFLLAAAGSWNNGKPHPITKRMHALISKPQSPIKNLIKDKLLFTVIKKN